MKISESVVYVISQQIFLGGREIPEEEGEIVPKISPKRLGKFCEFNISPKPQHYMRV